MAASKQQGLSLIELLMALAISACILLSAQQFLFHQLKTLHQSIALRQLDNEVQRVLFFVKHIIHKCSSVTCKLNISDNSLSVSFDDGASESFRFFIHNEKFYLNRSGHISIRVSSLVKKINAEIITLKDSSIIQGLVIKWSFQSGDYSQPVQQWFGL